ncbi:unnamed protein product [Taenia asiatica]|uniref:Cilia- and flagella-associated protein 157 n=1 Tax=Taenia asiatica TaxID=60517 RepID=A0A0R3WBI2_TAEAS|nr:unnamed protein product [Taenia asiatica]
MATEESVVETTDEKPKQEEDKQKNVLGLTKKQRKRELKFIASELRTIPEDASDEDKLIALYRKFQVLNSENNDMSSKLKLTDKRILSVAAERDQYLDSFNRVNMQKEKLEALCRELQKQNHLIRDQSLAMAQSEDEKRKEVADRFQSGINEIQAQLNDYLEKNNKLREENQMLADKLQKFITDHEKREEYVQKMLKTRELETKLAEAKAVQARAVQEQAVLREKRETERAREECSLLKQRLEAHQLVEEKLKEQIEFYKNKYQSFNKTMAKSNDLIENTKKEMQKVRVFLPQMRLASSDGTAMAPSPHGLPIESNQWMHIFSRFLDHLLASLLPSIDGIFGLAVAAMSKTRQEYFCVERIQSKLVFLTEISEFYPSCFNYWGDTRKSQMHSIEDNVVGYPGCMACIFAFVFERQMTKHVRTAESAALEWRSKWEVSQKALLDMIDECRKEKEKSQALQKQVDSLSNLCRALRANTSSTPKGSSFVHPECIFQVDPFLLL